MPITPMSPRRSKALVERLDAPPGWLLPLLGAAGVAGDEPFDTNGTRFVMRGGIPRQVGKLSAEQDQTAETFGFKWRKDDLFNQKEYLAQVRSWMLERYGDVEHAHWWDDYGPAPLILDAGCGAALTAIEMFGDRLKSVRYLGADVSTAVDVAHERFGARGYPRVPTLTIFKLPSLGKILYYNRYEETASGLRVGKIQL